MFCALAVVQQCCVCVTLLLADKLDPREQAKQETREWVNDVVDRLTVRIEQFEYEMEEMQATLKKKAKPPPKLVQVRDLLAMLTPALDPCLSSPYVSSSRQHQRWRCVYGHMHQKLTSCVGSMLGHRQVHQFIKHV